MKKVYERTFIKSEVILKMQEFVDEVCKKYLYAEEYLPQEMGRFITKYLRDERFKEKEM